jgi:hypothetical protein
MVEVFGDRVKTKEICMMANTKTTKNVATGNILGKMA